MSPEKKKQIREFIDSLDRQDQIWTLGFLDGMLNGSSVPGIRCSENFR